MIKKFSSPIKILATVFVLLFFCVVGVFVFFEIEDSIQAPDCKATVKLTDDATIQLYLERDFKLSRHVTLRVCNEKGQTIRSFRLNETGKTAVCYEDMDDTTWKELEKLPEEREDGAQVFQAIWGTITVQANGDIRVDPE